MVAEVKYRMFVIILVIILFLQSGFIFFHAMQAIDSGIHGRASGGTVSMCLNHQPELSFDCNTSMRQDIYYSCPLDYSDPDNDTLSFFYENESEYFKANITDDGLFETTPTQEMVGNRTVHIGVIDSKNCSNSRSAENITFTISNVNDPPEYVKQISDMTWSLRGSYRGVFLKDHFDDPDGDPLNYSFSLSTSKFNVQLLSSSEVILSADECGEGYVTFSAEDPYNESAESHIINLEVPCEQPTTSSGGSSSSSSSSFQECEPEWECDDWSECYPNGTQKRECTDIHGCEEDYKRTFWQECEYIPQCENGVQDDNEEGVDCGGPCPPCETCDDGILNNQEEEVDCGGPNCPACKNCSDGIRNYGEEGVDCGGPCPPCPSCNDGIQNQGEEGVDCGGPCPPCAETEEPGAVGADRTFFMRVILPLLFSAFVLAVIYKFFHKRLHMLFAKFRWFVSRGSKKQYLLSSSQKGYLLKSLSSFVEEYASSSDFSEIQSHLSSLYRKMYFFLIGQAFDVNDASSKIHKLNTSKQVKHLLITGYSITHSIETSRLPSRTYIDVYTELFRELVISLSSVEQSDIARYLNEKEPSSKSSVDDILCILYNNVLALQFSEIHLSEEKYLDALNRYGSLSAPEQEKVYLPLHLTFELINYVSSYTSDK